MKEMHPGSNPRKLIVVIAVFVIAVFLLLSLREKYLPYFGHYLVIEQEVKISDAIFVFGGSVPNRIIEAVNLFKNGYSDLIIISKFPKPEGYDYLKKIGVSFPEGHETSKYIAHQMGVPEKNIVIFPKRTSSTFEELILLSGYLKSRNMSSVILVSSKSHTRRISIIFSDISGGDIKSQVIYTRFDGYNPDSWWKDRNSLRQTLFEYQKIIHHLLIDRNKISSFIR